MRASENGKAGYRFYDGAVTCGRILWRVAQAKKRDESTPVSLSIDVMRKQDGVTRDIDARTLRGHLFPNRSRIYPMG